MVVFAIVILVFGTGKLSNVGKDLGSAIREFRNRVGWIFGSEGGGVSAGLQALAAAKVTIPMSGAESLNVAAAAAICLFFSRPAGRS